MLCERLNGKCQMKNMFWCAVLAVLSTLFVTEGQSATSIDYVSLVDPRIETARGRWFFSTPAARPFGMVKLTPHSINAGQGGGGYNASIHRVLGFCHVHGWLTTGLEVMPTTGGNFSINQGEEGWKSAYDQGTEIVKPGYHKLYLDKYDMWVELTTTARVGFHRYTYKTKGSADIIINLGGPAGPMAMGNGHITKISNTEVEGYYDRINPRWGGPAAVRHFFVIKLDTDFSSFTTYDDGYGTSGYITYDSVTDGQIIQMKVGLSFTSIANARNNLNTELNHWNFDAVRDDSYDEWNSMLGKIEVTGGTTNQKIKFYTDLWHVLLGRHILEDVNGQYPDYTNGNGGNDNVLKIRTLPSGVDHYYNSDAYWLTHMNLNTLWGLAWPGVLDDFANSLLEMARVGGNLPRGPCGGGYTTIMTGNPATSLLVGAYMKGISSFDVNVAFNQMKKDHLPGGMMGQSSLSGNGNLQFYIDNGWDSNANNGGAGRTLEWAFEDWCLSQLALKLGRTDDYNEFRRRSGGWKHLYHSGYQLIFPKWSNGDWFDTNGLSGWGYIEATAWQATWFIPHDVQGLINLMGGPDQYTDKLNYAFEREVSRNFLCGNGAGYVNYANQQSLSNAHMFNYAQAPWLSQYWVRQVNEKVYGGVTLDTGYGGNDEDQGQMGGVSALMSIGLFSVRGSCDINPIYEITSPVFDTITIHLDPNYYTGSTFVISTTNNSEENCYIQSAKLDGSTLNKCWFYHSQFADGGTLELTLGPDPNCNWGSGESNAPPSESSPGGPPALPIPIPDPADNLALSKTVTVSSSWGEDFAGSYAVDGNKLTRWCSAPSENDQWIYVDLGSTYSINRVRLLWEIAHAGSYNIQVSDDASTWTDIYSTTTEDGGTDDIEGLSGSGRYVRMYENAGTGAYSLWEFEVYGGDSLSQDEATKPLPLSDQIHYCI